MTVAVKTGKRILICAGCYADALGAIRLADCIAESLASDLGGLLVEESAGADIAFLPRQRVVTSSGALLDAPSRQLSRRIIESDAKAFQRSLAGLAQTRMTSWSFERREGELIERLIEAAAGWDVVLLGHREVHKRQGRVVLVVDSTHPSGDAGTVAGQIATALGVEVISLVLDRALALGSERTDGEILSSMEELLSRISRINAAAVVVDLAIGPVRSHEHLRRVLSVARCPVIVLSADCARLRKGGPSGD